MDIVQKIAAGGETDASTSSPGDGKPKVALTFTKVTVAPPVVGSGTLVTPRTVGPGRIDSGQRGREQHSAVVADDEQIQRLATAGGRAVRLLRVT